MVLRPEVLRHPGQVMFPDQSDLDLAASVPLPAVASAPPVAAVSVMGSASVSYTHLDVYKRQYLYCV